MIIPPKTNHYYTIIWLHGLGADGHDFEGIIPELNLDDSLGIKFVFPHAPIRPVTINGKIEMRAWYDIVGFNLNDRADIGGINQSINLIDQIIQNEIKSGISERNIILAGFSQGAVIALHMLLRSGYRFPAVIALSSYLPCFNEIKNEISAKDKSTEVFFAHGTLDPVVPYNFGKEAYEELTKIGFICSWYDYPMQHQVCWNEIKDLSAFITKITKDSTVKT